LEPPDLQDEKDIFEPAVRSFGPADLPETSEPARDLSDIEAWELRTLSSENVDDMNENPFRRRPGLHFCCNFFGDSTAMSFILGCLIESALGKARTTGFSLKPDGGAW